MQAMSVETFGKSGRPGSTQVLQDRLSGGVVAADAGDPGGGLLDALDDDDDDATNSVAELTVSDFAKEISSPSVPWIL